MKHPVVHLGVHGSSVRGGVANQRLLSGKEFVVPESVLDAIRQGQWDFEPEDVGENQYDSTGALPGSPEKIRELADRAEEGLPLWHPDDRRSFDDTEDALK